MCAVMAANHLRDAFNHLVIAFKRCQNLFGDGLIIRIAIVTVILCFGNVTMYMFRFIKRKFLTDDGLGFIKIKAQGLSQDIFIAMPR